jgi:hypothetical protein
LDDWTVIVLLLGSIIGLTAFVTIIARRRFRGSIMIAVASILGIFAGVSGASHGPGEILQGNIDPGGIIIEAWPTLTLLAGGPAMTLIPNFSVSGILTVILGLAVTIWAATRIRSKNRALVLIMLSTIMLFCRWRSIPPMSGVVAGIIGLRVRQKDLKTPHQKL